MVTVATPTQATRSRKIMFHLAAPRSIQCRRTHGFSLTAALCTVVSTFTRPLQRLYPYRFSGLYSNRAICQGRNVLIPMEVLLKMKLAEIYNPGYNLSSYCLTDFSLLKKIVIKMHLVEQIIQRNIIESPSFKPLVDVEL